MQKLSSFVVAASAAALVMLPAGAALAQSAPAAATGTATTAPAATAPATTAPATAAPAAAASDTTADKDKSTTKKKKPAKVTRQQEIDRSIDRGTVPARYRSSVPKEYHQYIPFDKK